MAYGDPSTNYGQPAVGPYGSYYGAQAPWQSQNLGNFGQAFLNPTGYQQSNLTPLEQQALLSSGALLAQGTAPIGSSDQYLQAAQAAVNRQYGAFAPEMYQQGAREAQGAASSAATRGISGGLGQANQLQISNETQQQLNQLRGQLQGQAQQYAMGARGQDIQNALGRLGMGNALSQYPTSKAPPGANSVQLLSLLGSLYGMGGMGGGGGFGGGFGGGGYDTGSAPAEFQPAPAEFQPAPYESYDSSNVGGSMLYDPSMGPTGGAAWSELPENQELNASQNQQTGAEIQMAMKWLPLLLEMMA